MTAPRPFVTAVVPCRNEAAFIRRCLESLVVNDYPADRLEILVVDGLSDDGTREIVCRYAERHQHLRMLDNPAGIIPIAMNIGVRAARGDLILKVDAHSTYPGNYISMCAALSQQYGADNVGGVLITEPSEPTIVARAIALVLAHPFGSGNSRFRVGCAEPVWADTAAFGCYRRDVFERVGLYDEHLARSSDMDLNVRLRKAGGRILLAPQIVARYYPRPRLGEFTLRNLLDGFWAIYPVRWGSRLARLRHIVPGAALFAWLLLVAMTPVFATARWAVLGAVASYVALATAVSVIAAAKMRMPVLAPLLPLVFAIRHIAYAMGSLWGGVRALATSEFWSRRRPAAPQLARPSA